MNPSHDPADPGQHTNPFADWPRPLAFAFSGGGAFGSSQVGMVRALLERGITPDLIVGTSVGSLHGALLAARPDEAVEVMTELWTGMDRRALFGGRRDAMVSLARHRSLARFDRLQAMLAQHLGVDRFEEMVTPFAAVATEIVTGEPELLSTGPVIPALLASSAVPGVFPRVEIASRTYVDGGVSANVPIRQAIAFGAASVIVLDATPPSDAAAVPSSMMGGLIHSVSLMLRNQRAHAVDELAHRYPVAVLPSATPPDIGTFNFDRTLQLLDDSYDLARSALDDWTGAEKA